MFYDIFLNVCEEKNTSPAQVRRDLSISQSTMASWKSKGLTPNATTVARLAEYFNVSVDYLLGKEDCPTPVFERMNDDTLQMLSFLDLPPQKLLQFDNALHQLLKTQEIICKGIMEDPIYEKLCSLATDKEFAEFFAALQVFSAVVKEMDKINPEGIHRLRAKYAKWNDEMDTFNKIYGKLNDEGRRKAIERVRELTEIPRFQRNTSMQE